VPEACATRDSALREHLCFCSRQAAQLRVLNQPVSSIKHSRFVRSSLISIVTKGIDFVYLHVSYNCKQLHSIHLLSRLYFIHFSFEFGSIRLFAGFVRSHGAATALRGGRMSRGSSVPVRGDGEL
jgi:hypothetical protein